jgi:hypothetical protein
MVVESGAMEMEVSWRGWCSFQFAAVFGKSMYPSLAPTPAGLQPVKLGLLSIAMWCQWCLIWWWLLLICLGASEDTAGPLEIYGPKKMLTS